MLTAIPPELHTILGLSTMMYTQGVLPYIFFVFCVPSRDKKYGIVDTGGYFWHSVIVSIDADSPIRWVGLVGSWILDAMPQEL